ncbi:uncharacterized protein B0I36DRAFT_245887 [Microdochium trichocladiopsis]|uniref:PRA1 family protein n=1 Tax=Microdochium trichocladiopsis TaxID=1682393 RepID=A0A9P8Y3A5_9PEZI|nr:uncharacterized protein B0I36DRAFT_245887 [Microdochium trichocladiopsis]KAH7029714.1 hypothetical protein B0I36DRAFT_245887 [Microdochium trichocladiopsis]
MLSSVEIPSINETIALSSAVYDIISKLLDLEHISIPRTYESIKFRIKFNLNRFWRAYCTILIVLTLYTFLTNWRLLFDVVLFLLGTAISRSLNYDIIRLHPVQVYTTFCIAFLLLRISAMATLLSTIGTGSLMAALHSVFVGVPEHE